VEDDAVVKAFTREEDEVVDRIRDFISKQLDHHGAFVGFHVSGVFLLRVDLHRGRGAPLLGHVFSF